MDIEYIKFDNFLSLQNNKNAILKLNIAQNNFNESLKRYKDLEGKHYVLVTGILNSGKSSLCNMLVGDNTDSIFKTGDRRVTTEIQKYTDTATGATYIDTPGLDANKNDDEEAKKSLCIANLIVFVCSMASGAIGDSKEQVDYLKHIINFIPNISKRIAFACTKFGITENYIEPYNKTINQIYKIFGKKVPVFLVDNHWYLDGIKHKDSDLIDDSGIPKLKKWITSNILNESPYYSILYDAKNKYINALNDAKIEINKTEENIKYIKNNTKSIIINAWDSCKSNLKNKYTLYKIYKNI